MSVPIDLQELGGFINAIPTSADLTTILGYVTARLSALGAVDKTPQQITGLQLADMQKYVNKIQSIDQLKAMRDQLAQRLGQLTGL